MDVSIYTLRLGFSNCYLVRSEGVILVDCGMPNQLPRFKAALENYAIKPQDISLVVLTHGHPDHIGSAAAIKTYTGAPIAMHYLDKDCLETGRPSMPPGSTLWGRLLIRLMALAQPSTAEAAPVDVVIPDEGLALVPYGIPGRIVCTPGHSAGSISVLLEDGSVMVGDMAMNGLPLRLGPGLPVFATDMGAVLASWRLLLAQGARTIYPGHGKPFSTEVMRRAVGG